MSEPMLLIGGPRSGELIAIDWTGDLHFIVAAQKSLIVAEPTKENMWELSFEYFDYTVMKTTWGLVGYDASVLTLAMYSTFDQPGKKFYYRVDGSGHAIWALSSDHAVVNHMLILKHLDELHWSLFPVSQKWESVALIIDFKEYIVKAKAEYFLTAIVNNGISKHRITEWRLQYTQYDYVWGGFEFEEFRPRFCADCQDHILGYSHPNPFETDIPYQAHRTCSLCGVGFFNKDGERIPLDALTDNQRMDLGLGTSI